MDSANLNQLADAILTALGGHNYLLAMSLALIVAVKGARWLAPKLHDKTGAFLNSDRGGALLSLLLSLGAGLATTLAAGKPVNLTLLAKVLLVAASGSGLFNLTKRLAKPSDKAAPAAAPTTPPVAALLPLLLIPSLLLAGCATPGPIPAPPPPNSDAFNAAFKSCCSEQGVVDATSIGAQAWQALSKPGQTAQQIEVELENLAMQAGGTGVALLVGCAVQAWMVANPIPSNVAPTPPQTAARLYRAKHLTGVRR